MEDNKIEVTTDNFNRAIRVIMRDELQIQRRRNRRKSLLRFVKLSQLLELPVEIVYTVFRDGFWVYMDVKTFAYLVFRGEIKKSETVEQYRNLKSR